MTSQVTRTDRMPGPVTRAGKSEDPGGANRISKGVPTISLTPVPPTGKMIVSGSQQEGPQTQSASTDNDRIGTDLETQATPEDVQNLSALSGAYVADRGGFEPPTP